MATVHREIEAKYEADDAVQVPSLVELFGAVRGQGGVPPSDGTPWAEGEPAEHDLSATYYDTSDLDLAAAGLTLRRRTGGDDTGWHLKVPVADGERAEVREPLGDGANSADRVPARLVRMTFARTGGRDLVPIAQIDTHRSVRRLVDATGQVLAEVADDRVTARRLHPSAERGDGSGDAGGDVTTWREIEVELVDGPRELLAAVDPLLREHGLTPAATTSKLLRTLGADAVAATPRGAAPAGSSSSSSKKAEKRRRRALRSASAADVVLRDLAAQVAQIRTQDLPVRLDLPGAVHAMRVASRRLRSLLTTYEPLFRRRVSRPLGHELRWLAGVLGTARDAEVMRDRLNTSVAEEGDDAHLGSAVPGEVSGQLEQAYRRAHDKVLAQLDGDRYRTLLTTLGALVEDPPFKDRASRPAGDVLPQLVARSYEQLRAAMKAAGKATGDPREKLLHDARKAAKRTRYAAESVAPVIGKSAREFATAMERVQETLGEHLESGNTRARLRELAAHTTLPTTAFTYGRLHAQEDARAERTGTDAERAWKAASGKRLRRWFG